MTLGRLESEMSWSEMLEWMAFFKMENEEREKRMVDQRAAAAKERAKARPRPVGR